MKSFRRSGSDEERATNGGLPLGAAFGEGRLVGRRLVRRPVADPGADRLEVRPDAGGEAGERGGAECRRLSFGGDLDRAAEQIGLELP
jgi:hypothetical protein